jgi:CheY-like chemotaxis protein
VSRSPDLPKSMQTDSKRLQQILKNLLSNAFKFTRQGQVSLEMYTVAAASADEDAVIAFAVSDTGIGIPSDKQQIIFEAFQQADGSTSRKYGGTGLGLAISRELSRLLGGEIQLESAPGEGSRFTLYLPLTFAASAAARRTVVPARDSRAGAAVVVEQPQAVNTVVVQSSLVAEEIEDDRGAIGPGDRVILVIENDLNFARMLLDVAHEHGYKGLVTAFGATALSLAEQYHPDAITLDISLPDIVGWRVLQRLKHAPSTRHIPVYVITTDEDRDRGLREGAFGMLTKPIHTRAELDSVLDGIKSFVERDRRELLIVEPDAMRRARLKGYVPDTGVDVVEASTAADALAALERNGIDCVILNPRLPDMGAAEFVDRLIAARGDSAVPVLIHGEDGFTVEEAAAVRRLSQVATVREVHRPERLLDLSALFLHQPLDELSPTQRDVIEELRNGEGSLRAAPCSWSTTTSATSSR